MSGSGVLPTPNPGTRVNRKRSPSRSRDEPGSPWESGFWRCHAKTASRCAHGWPSWPTPISCQLYLAFRSAVFQIAFSRPCPLFILILLFCFVSAFDGAIWSLSNLPRLITLRSHPSPSIISRHSNNHTAHCFHIATHQGQCVRRRSQ